MTREELIDAVCDRLGWSRKSWAVGRIIDEMNTLYREKHGRDVTELFGDGWIPVTERLPEPKSCVLVYTENDDVWDAWFDGSGFDRTYMRLEYGVVTHWMPLPSPPEPAL